MHEATLIKAELCGHSQNSEPPKTIATYLRTSTPPLCFAHAALLMRQPCHIPQLPCRGHLRPRQRALQRGAAERCSKV